MLRRPLQGQHGVQRREGAAPVVVAEGGDHAPVKAQLPGLGGGHHDQLRGEEVLLPDAILLMQELQHRQLHAVAALVLRQRNGAHQHVQILPGDAGGQRLLHLGLGEMDQQVRDNKHRIVVLFADADLYHCAVLLHHHAVDRHGHGGPLVLLDAAVIVGLEERHLVLLVKGIGLEIQPGVVDVGGGDPGALGQGLFPDDRQIDGLAADRLIDPVAGL